MKPLAITGVGVVSPIGTGFPAFRASLDDPMAAAAEAFRAPPTVLSPERVPDPHAAEIRDFDAKAILGPKGHRNFDRLTKFLIASAKLALEMAGVKRDGQFVRHGPGTVGVCSSTAYGSLDAITELHMVAELEDPRYINPARFPNTVINAAAGYVSIWEDLQAPNTTIVDGNCGALDAVLTCETHLGHRRADAFLVGGGEVLSEALYLAFRKLGVVAEGVAPTLSEEGGIHFGEGCAYFFVERRDTAREADVPVLAEILGYGTAFDAPGSQLELVHGSDDATARAIRMALEDAGVAAGEVDAVVSARNGLSRIDGAERRALEGMFGPSVPVVAPKAIYGETFGAGGALGMATALAWFDGAPLAPLWRGEPRAERPRTVVVDAVGFYGNVSAVVLRRP